MYIMNGMFARNMDVYSQIFGAFPQIYRVTLKTTPFVSIIEGKR